MGSWVAGHRGQEETCRRYLFTHVYPYCTYYRRTNCELRPLDSLGSTLVTPRRSGLSSWLLAMVLCQADQTQSGNRTISCSPKGLSRLSPRCPYHPWAYVIQACTARSPIHASGDAKPPLRHGRCIAVVVSSLRGALGRVATYYWHRPELSMPLRPT